MTTERSGFAIYGRELEEERAYWLGRLSTETGTSNLVLDFERPSPYSYSAGSAEITLPEELSQKLAKLTGDSPFLLYTTLLTALNICLHKYTGNKYIVVGSPARSKQDDASVKANALSIINEVDERLSVKQFLLNVRQTLLDAYSKQTYPYALLIRDLKLEGVENRCPLFDVALRLKEIHAPLPEVRNDVTITFSKDNDRVAGVVEFNERLFAADSIHRFKRHFLSILKQSLDNTGEMISNLQVLTESERRQMLVEWNDTRRDYPQDSYLHKLFEAQVGRTPGNVALFYEGEQLTYEEVNRRANRLAHYLRRQGVGPESIVAICVERSFDMVVAILGAFKAGAAYVPLDPKYPKERLAFMLEDAKAAIVLTHEQAADSLPDHNARTIRLDSDWGAISQEGDENPSVDATPDNLAYIIYTSGSTGQPKGVMVAHREICNTLLYRLEAFGLTESDSVLQNISFAFDPSIWQIFGALLAGGRLVLARPGGHQDTAYLARLIAGQRVSVTDFVPSTLQVFLSEPQVGRCDCLRLVFVGGEFLPAELKERFHSLLKADLYNVYGPTEASIDATFWHCRPDDARPVIPIGRPIANKRVYVLDSLLRPAPVGAAGELYIAGMGLARGYLNQPALTAERFIPDPFGERPGGRLYRTGDLARYLADGSVQFLGRVDDQVKVRGFRIELGEIDSVIRGLRSVQDAITLVREDAPGSKQIVSYVVCDPELSHAELRSLVKERLPEHMIPSAFVRLDEIPLLPSGKVDRRSLPAPDYSGGDRGAGYEAPRNEIEKNLAEIWSEVLEIERVGINDNFFDLGGHSLLATQVASRISEAFNVELPVRTLFDATSVAALAEVIESELGVSRSQPAAPIVRVPRDGELPLSFAQQRLWFIDQLEPDSPAYIMLGVARLDGPLDVSALEQSINEIVKRHEVLRTSFAAEDGRPRQVIAPSLHVPVAVTDLTRLGRREQEAEVRRFALEDARTPFNLSTGPLLRAGLLRLGEDESVFLFTMHHIVSDGWSMGVLVREVAALYESFSKGLGSPLEDLPLQYADYAHWQRQWLQGGVLEQQVSYWRHELAGSPPLLELPTDRPRPSVQTSRGATQELALTESLSEAVISLGQRAGATPFMTLLAAFNALLCRYTGQEDILIGTPIANRNRVETENLIGVFVNTLVIRTDLSGGPGFQELLARVRETTLRAYAHQELPFETLVEELQPQRDMSHTPLFQVMFDLRNTPMPALSFSGLTLTPINVDSGTAKFDLTLSMEESGQRIIGSVEYNTDLFDASTVGRMIGHFKLLIEGAVAAPDRSISLLPLLTGAEREQVLVEWNKTGADYPAEACLHRLFERQVERTPEAVAVVFKDEQLSFRGLNRRANQLAHYLIRNGVGPDMPVGICVERSVEMLVGMFGILKAGGAYVPLDPEYPGERLAFMMSNAGARLALVQQRFSDSIPGGASHAICLDAGWQPFADESEENPESGVTADNLAYVIYTSGSTGKPKGVMISHRAICNNLLWNQERFRVNEADSVIQKYSFSFDSSIVELLGAPLCGSRLVICEPGRQQDSAYLTRLFVDEKITFLDLVPSLLQLLMDEQEFVSRNSLRAIVCGGETLSPELSGRVLNDLDCALYNAYGPTEYSISATVWHCEQVENLRTVPIGKPISNTQVYVLDAKLQPVPVGVPGELYVGGIGVARCYASRPDLTAEKFIPNPFSNDPGARIYGTGDLVRHLPDGNIEMLGRVDTQVKVRGFRIEPGEIEAALSQHPSVGSVLVTARDSSAGVKRLVAYVVRSGDATPAAGELRAFARRTLPDYMIPSAFVALDAFPLTMNGKIDLRALPPPDDARPDLENEFVSPRTRVEETLAEIFGQVLGLTQVGVNDNFFELGGDSILSIQVIARANKAGLRLTPKQLFQNQTVGQLAKVASTAAARPGDDSLVTGPLPLTPVQHWFFEQGLPDAHHYNQAVMLEARRPLDPALVEASVKRLIQHHDALRLRFRRGESGWQQFNGDDSESVPFITEDFSGVAATERKVIIEAAATEWQASLDITSGPLLRVVLFDLGADEPARLLIVIHHLAVDGVSWRILLEDLQTVYTQLEQGKSPELAPKTTSFKRWAERLVEYAQSEQVQTELAYWSSEAGPEAASLPVDHPGASNTAAASSSVTVALSEGETRALVQELPPTLRTQINDVLLTALIQSFHRWAGIRTLLINLEGHGREELFDDLDVSRTVGWFTTVFPVRLELSGGADPAEALKSVKEKLRRIPQRGVGYGLLRYLSRETATDGKLRSAARPQVSFNYLGQFDQAISQSSLFKPAGESSGPAQGRQGNLHHLIDINAMVSEGRLQVEWTYSENVYDRPTVERLAGEFLTALRSLIGYARESGVAVYTPSDFPLAGLDQQRLDALIRPGARVEDIYPLSPLQQGMLFHSLYSPESEVYFEQMSGTFHGPFDVEAFRRAWQAILDRHSALRTSFIWESLDDPLQVVFKDVDLPFQQEDWSNLPASEQSGRLQEFLSEDRRRRFELSEPPLMRLVILKLSDDSHRFIWSHHHLLLDGWSMPLIFREAFTLYDAFRSGKDLRLEPPTPYREYIAWLRGQDSAKAEAFWRRTLEGFTAPTPLVVDRLNQVAAAEESYGEVTSRLSEATTSALNTVSRQNQLTLNTLAQGAWALLLGRYSGEGDVVFGATVSGRPAALAGVESMVGLFINTIAVRARIAPRASTKDWLKGFQDEQVEARQFEFSPLVQVQGWSQIPRGLPLFESLFVFENYPIDAALQSHTERLGVSDVQSYEKTNYPLTVTAVPGKGMALQIDYDLSRFDGPTVGRMMGHLEGLLEAMAADPERPVFELPLLRGAERRQALFDWNEVEPTANRRECIHELFEAQVERTPGAVALAFEGEELTYGEFNRRANNLAHHLRSLGIGPDDPVGLCVRRSVEMMVGIMGILKAGGAYVPLDPAYPKERLAFMLEDSRMSVLLTQQGLVEALPGHQAQVICLDSEWAKIDCGNDENPRSGVKPDNLAYVIYTSGSTGRPKGVMIGHRSLVSYTNTAAEKYGVGPGDRVLQFCSISFDISGEELYPCLTRGAALVLRTERMLDSIPTFLQKSDEWGLTVMSLPTAYWHEMVAALEADGLSLPPSLRLVIVAGERMLPERLAAWHERTSARTRLINTYGPTEATISVSMCELAWRQADGRPPQDVSIGKVIPGAQIYVLDGDLQPVPIGVPGELYIGGLLVGRGYFNRPELTAVKFIPHPFSSEPGARLYRSEDLAFYMPDGSLQFVGRADQQVKIRGFRVELEEIDSVLSRHHNIREAVTVAREDAPGSKRIVAYLVAGQAPAPSGGELRAYLKDRLPDFMIPSAFVTLEALPLTVNGKVDRKALPAPDQAGSDSDESFKAPRTPIEEIVAGVWAQSLGVRRAGLDDNFFDLGGHSLLATQAASRLRNAFNVDVPLRLIFETPTPAALAASIEARIHEGRSLKAPPIQPIRREGPLPLSFAQQRLWFIDQLEPGRSTYNIPAAVRLTGRLDEAALEQTLNEITLRHEILRTTFSSHEGMPVQVIAPAQSRRLHVEDLSGLDGAGREAEAFRLAEEEAQKPFDLATGPLIRAELLRLGGEDHILLLTMHHIVSDGWSITVMLRELAALYAAFSAGLGSPLDPLPIQYADFAHWQREWLQGELLDAQLDYWKRKLAGLPASLDLPTDRPRPAFMSLEGSTESSKLPGGLSDSLKEFSRREGATLFMTLLAGFGALLHRYTGQEDIVVGSPIANRNRAEVEGLIGFFVNTLALRAELPGDISFTELVRQVKRTSLEAYAHQDLPFEKLVEEIQPERDLSRSPLFQVVFAFDNQSRTKTELPGLEIETFDSGKGTAKFDLTLFVTEDDGGLNATVEYNTDLFDSSTVARMLGHYQALLLAAVEDPRRELARLPILTPPERDQLLFGWNDTRREYPRDATIQELFEGEVKRRPEAIAIEYRGEMVSYRALNERANRLAHYLLKQGVRADEAVALLMERSPEIIETLLAILKAGGAYLPLDPDYPQERVKYAISDAGAGIVITQARLKHRLEGVDARVISLEDVWPEVSGQGEDNPCTRVDAQNLAYVIYTSGSTGTPKGICISHRSVARLVKSADYARMGEDEVFLQLAPVPFDASTFEIWASLLNGARLAIMPAETPTLEELGAAIRRHGVTTLWLTSGLFHLMVDERVEDLRPVKQVITGGDVLSVSHAERFLGAARGSALINAYGPTENTTFTSCHEIKGPAGDLASIPIGRPIANTQVYILDGRLEPVPAGVIGDLYAGGDGLARGYLKRADMTAEKFLPDPFAMREGARLYKTGDLARYLADGRVEFRGRRDNQVKLRGFRIELGEIESVLAQHPALREVAVIAREEGGDKRLVAYVVPADGRAVEASDLRSHLEDRLPDYMIPAAFVALERLPLTANGKLDRRALPAPDWGQGDSASARPRTAIEGIIAAIWSEVLGLERVGVEDNLFELGGHSLLATRLISRVRETFNVEMPLRKLFESPTVRDMARNVEAMRGTGVQAPPIGRVSRDEELPLSFAQQRLWFLDQLEPESPFYNIPVGMRLTGRLNVDALERSLNEVVRRHEVLRTRFEKLGTGVVQRVEKESPTRLVITDLSGLDEEERAAGVNQLSAQEATRPFDLARGPLLRMNLLKLSDEEFVLLLTMHHIVSDGWSMEVLVREMASLYEAFAAGRPSPLDELPIQYADYARWQREWLQGELLDAQLGYWRAQLRDAPAVLQLPTDRPRPPVQTFAGATIGLPLPQATADALTGLSNREGVTLFMTMLAAFQALLYRYTGQPDVTVGTPVAGRNRLETEGLIGLFVNTLVMRTVLAPGLSFSGLLRKVRDTVIDGHAHQDVPFEKLLEELGVERSLSWPPLFQVLLTLQNAPQFARESQGVKMTPLVVDNDTAKFDLTLLLTESAGGLSAAVEYNTDLFDSSTVTRMLGHYQALLLAAVEDPRRELARLPILTRHERHQLLFGWNDTRAENDSQTCVHELFELQARRRPGAVAVIFERREITYGELDARANQLANHLRGLGVGPESLVGVYMERGLEMVVALLGVLKSGGAYVPLDPSYPKQRLAFMLEDTRARVLLTQGQLRGGLPEHGCKVIYVDTEWEVIERESRGKPAPGVTADNLVYVIYTSGSTGNPKGAMLPHRQISNRLLAGIEVYGLGPDSTFLHKTPLSFDPSVIEIFSALLSGARLVVARPGAQGDSAYLVDLMVTHRVTHAFFVPSMLKVFLQEPRVRELGSVEMVESAAEALTIDIHRRFFERLNAKLVNFYGPTEASISIACYLCRPGEQRQVVPIGRPLSNIKIYLLDENLEPVPLGVSGEVYIGGMGPGRGYVKRPHLTAEKFIPDPFSEQGGGRLYRTGDLARYLPDGNIEFRGRIDHQVKIRGFRIELGEVEAALANHPRVKDVALLVREDTPGDKRLVAYVVGREAKELTGRELIDFLQQRLPNHMIPSSFVMLDALPLTPNGKVDRKALPAPDRSGAGLERVYKAARTPAEEVLVEVWGQVLGVERVGVEDNFFDLGGHSLLATQLISRVRSVFDVDLPLRSIFESPTISGLAESIEAAKLSERGADVPPLVPAPRDGDLPLSFSQQRLWFLDQLEPNSPFYNIATAVRLEGELDVAALGQSLNEIVRRHETLRTVFSTSEGQPVQIIKPAGEIRLEEVDLQGFSEAEREERLSLYVKAFAHRPFDLTAGPLVRASVVRLSELQHVLAISMHHIISDGWSSSILISEAASLYRSFASGSPRPLPPLPIQYADYALWQRRWLTGQALESELAYWRRALSGAPAAIDLPTDRPRPATQTYSGSSLSLDLGEQEVSGLRAAARSEGATLFMVTLAGMCVLLSRYSGQREVVVGTPVANRGRAETEHLIGCFINMLALRADLSASPTFTELIARVRHVALDAYAHQDVPFERLVDELQPERDLSRSPLFQVMFTLQNAPTHEMELGDLSLTHMDVDIDVAKYDLALSLQEVGGRLAGTLEYNTALFDASTVGRMASHFQVLIAALASNPALRVDEAPLLSVSERRQILVGWNDTEVAYENRFALNELIEAQVRRTPEAIALSFEGVDLTYDELNRRANQLARYLRGVGIGPESVVGVCVERGVEMVVGLLAVMKSGGAYAPLDPAHPAERLAFMLGEIKAPVLLTQARLLDRLPHGDAKVIPIDAAWGEVALEGTDDLRAGAGADNLAYVIFTSGSTGMPKGAMNTHRAICNRLLWMQDAYGLAAADSVLQKTPFSFDVSVWEFFWPLMVGARLVVASPGGHQDGAYLARLIEEEKITTLHFVPSMLQVFLEEPGLDAIRSLKRVICSGEALPFDLQERFFARVGAELHNLYGPTEAAVDVTFWACERESDRRSVPIGRPISNTRIYLLDERLQPVPIGVPGELYIGGEGLARGYFNRPELTADRFIPDPFGGPGARLYRTGDLARHDAGGAIEFLRRIDHQVKIRGLRIELGEIEHAINLHPAVRESVVVAAASPTGDRRLVAYVVAGEGAVLRPDDLRGFVKDRLPEYMIPSAIVALDRLPLSANGKVDRRSLPAPDEAGAQDGSETFAAARTPVEGVLVEIWGQVLGVKSAGIHDDFFALGGHSLLAARLISRVRDAFKVEVPLRRVFEAPTVARMAEVIEAAKKAGEGLTAPPITRAPRDGELPLSFAQQRLWFIDQLESGSAFYNIPAAVRLDGLLDLDALERSLNEIVKRHESLRTTFSASEGRPVQVISPSLNLNLDVFDLSDVSEDEREGRARDLISRELWRPFDLMRGPLVRASVVRLSELQHVLAISMHHIISDGWSSSILISEAASLYRSFASGSPRPLPPLPIQYADYALWQRRWLTGQALEYELAYWRRALSGAPAAIDLPTDRPRPATQTYSGSSLSLDLGEQEVSGLRAAARSEGATLFMVTLAGMCVLLSRYSGQREVVVGTPVANRGRAETEPLIGCFINVIVLRADLSNNPTYRELLRQVREVTLDAYAHQDVPFEKLVEALQVERDPSRTPLFQVMFALHNAHRPAVELPGLTLTPLEEENKAAHFDLNMAIQEEGQALSATLTYNTDLFNPETIARMLGDYKLILEAVGANPDVTFGELVDTLAQAEKQESDRKEMAFKQSSVDKLRNIRRRARN